MTAVQIDRLRLRVPAMPEAEAEALAREVGEALRRWPSAWAIAGRLDALAVRVPAPPPGEKREELADRIATAITAAALRELGR